MAAALSVAMFRAASSSAVRASCRRRAAACSTSYLIRQL